MTGRREEAAAGKGLAHDLHHGRDLEPDRPLEDLVVGDLVRRREARQLRGEDEDAHDEREPDRLQQVELEAVVVGDLAAFEPDVLQQRVQLDGVEPQMVRKPVDGAGAVVLQEAGSERLEGSLVRRLAAPGGAQGPEARVERDGVGADGVEARDLLRPRDHLDQEAQPGRALGELHEAVALGADGGAEPRHHVRHVAELLQDRVVGDRPHARRVAAVRRMLALAFQRARAALEQEV